MYLFQHEAKSGSTNSLDKVIVALSTVSSVVNHIRQFYTIYNKWTDPNKGTKAGKSDQAIVTGQVVQADNSGNSSSAHQSP